MHITELNSNQLIDSSLIELYDQAAKFDFT